MKKTKKTRARMGTMFVNETVLEIERFWLRDGRMWIYASMPGDNLAEGMTDVRIHAPDGSLVVMARVDMPRVGRKPWFWSGRTGVELPMRIEGSRPGEPWATHEESR